MIKGYKDKYERMAVSDFLQQYPDKDPANYGWVCRDGALRRLKLKKWHIYAINCDCSNYTWARLRKFMGFPRCRTCKKILGHMDANYIITIKARTERDAVKKFIAMDKD